MFGLKREKMSSDLTLYDKLWNRHLVQPGNTEHPPVIYIDLHLIQEVSSPQAFQTMKDRGLQVARPAQTFGMIDHSTPTLPRLKDGSRAYADAATKNQVETFLENCETFGVPCFGWDSADRGIVHVTGPEIGLTLPGMTIVCGDSHTSTHGAFGTLAFGIGTTEVGHVLVTQCLFQEKSKSLLVDITGKLPEGVSAKDLALYILQKIGPGGGTGHVIEYRGPAISALSLEGRMTICNMSIEAGARAGLMAPDETTFAWLKGRKHVPTGNDWDAALADWKTLKSDENAHFDKVVSVNASECSPMITFGTRPADNIPVADIVPTPLDDAARQALTYMQLRAGQPIAGNKIKTVFIGSCTNARLPDLRTAASIMQFGKVSDDVRALIVPGSNHIKRQAEAEGLDKIFIAAGAEWREAGCSMCVAMNGDVADPSGLTLSTTNRNFVGRQGPGARTLLCSPATAAASAINGVITDPRPFLERAA